MPEYDFDSLPSELAEETAPAGTNNTFVHNGTIWKKLTLATLKTWLQTQFSTVFQALLVNQTNIKSINNNSLLGSGNLEISGGGGASNLDGLSDVAINSPAQNHMLLRGATEWSNADPTAVKTALALQNVSNTSDTNKPISTATQTALDAKQATLVNQSNIKSVNGSSLLGSGNLTIEGGGSALYDKLTNYSSFQDFLTQWNTAGNPVKFLVVDTNASINFAAVVHSNLVAMPINGAKFIKSGSGYLEMKGAMIVCPARTQVFQGFTRTQVRWVGFYPEEVYPEWFGVIPSVDNTTTRDANSAAAKVMLEAFMSDVSVGRSPTASSGMNHEPIVSGKVIFGNAFYYFNDGFVINGAIDLSSTGGGILQFGTDKTCIRVNGTWTRGNVDPLDDVEAGVYNEYVGTASYGSSQTSRNLTINLSTPMPQFLVSGVFWMVGGTGTGFPADRPLGGNITSISPDGLTIQVYVQNVSFSTAPTHPWQYPDITASTPVGAFSGVTIRAVGYRHATWSRIHDIEIRGQRSAPNVTTHQISIADGHNINRVSGESFEMDKYFHDGLTFTYEGIRYVIGGHPDNPQPGNQMKLHRQRLLAYRQSANVYYLANYYGSIVSGLPPITTKWVGATVINRLTKKTHTITAVNAWNGTITLDGDDEPSGEFWLTELPAANFTNIDVRVNNKTIGIDMRIMIDLRNILVRTCDLAYAYDTLARPTIGDRVNTGQPNVNNAMAYNIRATDCGTGILARAVNGNNISFYNPDIQNTWVGIWDAPQHANSYYSMHMSFCSQGCISAPIARDASTPMSIQGSVFYDPYIEGSMAQLDLEYPASVIGGGASVEEYETGGGTQMFVRPGSRGWRGSAYEASYWAFGSDTVQTVRLFSTVGNLAGNYTQFNGFGLVENLGTVAAPNWLRSNYYNWIYAKTGYYGFDYCADENNDNPTFTGNYKPCVELTNAYATDGEPAGEWIFPKGFYLKNKLGVARPTANAASRGRVWVTPGGAGVADVVEICLKSAADTYSWKPIATG